MNLVEHLRERHCQLTVHNPVVDQEEGDEVQRTKAPPFWIRWQKQCAAYGLSPWACYTVREVYSDTDLITLCGVGGMFSYENCTLVTK